MVMPCAGIYVDENIACFNLRQKTFKREFT